MARRSRRRVPDPEPPAEPIPAETWGRLIEVPAQDSVDGDYNGAPELAAVEESLSWQGSDAVDAAERAASGEEHPLGDVSALAEELANRVSERRETVRARLDEARALGLEAMFESALALSQPGGPGAPEVFEEDVLRDQIRRLDAAIEALEVAVARS